jgi:hypothetical protein
MCVIIHRPPNVDIPFGTLQKCWNSNPHGAGVMYSVDNQLVIEKGFMDFNNFIKYYEKIPKERGILIHFRYGTSGTLTPDQCHPFLIHKNLACMHNGIIDQYHGMDDKKSDTKLFCDKILKQLPHNFLRNRGITLLIDEFTGGSILVFMDNLGKIFKIGQDSGICQEGCWFSNIWWEAEEKEFEFRDLND